MFYFNSTVVCTFFTKSVQWFICLWRWKMMIYWRVRARYSHIAQLHSDTMRPDYNGETALSLIWMTLLTLWASQPGQRIISIWINKQRDFNDCWESLRLRQSEGSGCFYLMHTLEVVSDLNLKEWALSTDGLISSSILTELYTVLFLVYPTGVCANKPLNLWTLEPKLFLGAKTIIWVLTIIWVTNNTFHLGSENYFGVLKLFLG